ncbi:related to ATP-dependent DNA helicase II, 80 kDa subunit (KU autoantigen protein P86) [Rhynchosporium agropyri]|uniref:ATP-dependent DNA helicase II subunit 2 n=1 Tax=Rhynchosporium agropyri TaxID=914238 RepID=A0A1E1KVB1_9HELO|nr:related to ATP-dependent DNA helicase II, 80 kDa subunit (KU autoantigen protein P86) [Rhynchosporium agropyri]
MSKEATIYVLDLGSTIGDCHNGRTISDLDYGMEYVWDKIATVMSANRATLSVGVVGFRTDETDNPLDGDGEYENICVLKELGLMDIPALESLRSKIHSSNTEVGDAVSAIIVAIDLMDKYTVLKTGKPAKFARKIVLVTDGQGGIDDDNIDSIYGKLNESGIELVVLGIDFDDAGFGFKEEDKTSLKQSNEAILAKLVEGCNSGMFATMAEALASLANPSVKVVRPFKQYDGRLGLGDFEKYPESALYIDVQRYSRVKQAKPPSASSFVSAAANATGEANAHSSHTVEDTEMMDAPGLSAVKSSVAYRVNDAAAAGGTVDLQREDLAKGYYYGSTAVPFGQDEEGVTRFNSRQGFSIIGFVPNDKYERYLTMGESSITIAQPVNDKARMAMSSLVHALHELDSYAVARIVTKDGKAPQLVLLAPSIEPDLECLIDVPLPFAEDIRVYRFPPLDKIIGSSGAVITKHRYLPSNELADAMSNYVDSMDLSSFGEDESGNPAEFMTMDETFSPQVHRVNQAIRQRAIHPDANLVSEAESQLEALLKVSGVTKVPEKVKGRKGREPAKPASGLDIKALLTSRKKKNEIALENAIPEFKQMIEIANKDEDIEKATAQMGKTIRQSLHSTTGDAGHAVTFSQMKVFRDEMIDLDMPEIYNDFCHDFKKRIFAEEFGDQRNFWAAFKFQKLGLIRATGDSEGANEEEATDFFKFG